MQWPREICVSSFDVTFNHASLGAAPCQCLVKDWSNRKLWKAWYTSHHCTHPLMFDCVVCPQGSLVLLRAPSCNQESDMLWPLQDVWFVTHPSCVDASDWATRILTVFMASALGIILNLLLHQMIIYLIIWLGFVYDSFQSGFLHRCTGSFISSRIFKQRSSGCKI